MCVDVQRVFYIGAWISEAGAAKQSAITIGTASHVCIEIENHATLLLWSTWLVAWITGVSYDQLEQISQDFLLQYFLH